MKWSLRWGILLLALLVLLATVGAALGPDPRLQPDLVNGIVLQPPSAASWLGTDQFSRDVFARLAHGARTSLSIGFLAVLTAATLGTLLGLLAGGIQGAPGKALSYTIDLSLALPRVVVLLVVAAAVGALSPVSLGLLLGLTGWPSVARLVRGETLRLAKSQFVLASRALGATRWRILSRDILPGAAAPVSVAAALGLADAMVLEAGLSFLGLGVRPPAPSWGGMIFEAREHLATAPWLLLAPAGALVTATFAAILIGDALRATSGQESR